MRKWRRAWLCLVLFVPACQQEMARQPSYGPLRPSSFFKDGRSARPLPAGVVARGQLLENSPLLTGLRRDKDQPARPNVPNTPANYVNAFPFPITETDLRRGQQRYTIYCTPCHSPLGDGHGKIVERGYVKPPSYVTDYSRGIDLWGQKVLLRDAPVGYYFEVVSHGYGAMPDYTGQISPEDRWRIIAYIRTLQLSQYATVKDLPAELRQSVQKALEEKK